MTAEERRRRAAVLADAIEGTFDDDDETARGWAEEIRWIGGVKVNVTHGRHCSCSACAREDWTNPNFVCGMHGPDCPHEYAPIKREGGRS